LYVDLKERGVPVDDIVLMPMANYGLQLYGNVIIVNSKFAADKPDAVRAFLDAFTRSLKETIRRPAEAVESILRRDDMARQVVELLRREAVLGWTVAVANRVRAGAMLVQRILIWRIDDRLGNARGHGNHLFWPELVWLISAWVAFGLFNTPCRTLVRPPAGRL